jgi:GcvH upstream region-like protein
LLKLFSGVEFFMSDFLKKHQSLFTLILASLLILPLTFFGTYSALSTPIALDKEAFKALNGSSVKRSDVENLALFLSTDIEDKQLMGGGFGPNFLNDGVIRKEFLETGLGSLLAKESKELLKGELTSKLSFEKKFRPYVHKNADFISAEAIWQQLIPQKVKTLNLLRYSSDPLEEQIFDARVSLFLAERRFGAPKLSQMIRIQEMQNPEVVQDPDLLKQDLSLFGYHTLEDWFGKRFIRLIASFIINASKIAEERGYKVSEREAYLDLIYQSQKSLDPQKNKTTLTAQEALEEQLHFMRLDTKTATKLWRQVLLFRRLFDETADSMFLTPLSFEPFTAYVKEGVGIDLYRVPESLKFNTFEKLELFEAYLDAVSIRPKGKPLELPSKFLTPQDVFQKYKELVKKMYTLQVKEIKEKKLLEAFSTKQHLTWQLDENHFKTLKNHQKELGEGRTKEERLEALLALDPKQKRKVDLFTARALLKEEKEMTQHLLEKTPSKTITVSLNPASKNFPFKGIKNKEAFLKELDKNSHLTFFDDENNLLEIVVIEKGKEFEVLTFEEAIKEKALDTILTKHLKNTYKKLQEKTPELFQNEDLSFKPFEEVKESVIKEHFKPLLEAIRKEVLASNLPVFKETLTNDQLASYRFLNFGKEFKEITERQLSRKVTGDLSKQFDFVKKEIKIERGGKGDLVDKQEAFSLPATAFSKLHALPNGELYFFQVKEKGLLERSEIEGQITKAKNLLKEDAKKSLTKQLLSSMTEKNRLNESYFESEKT